MAVKRASEGLAPKQRPQGSQGVSMWLFGRRRFKQRGKGLWQGGAEMGGDQARRGSDGRAAESRGWDTGQGRIYSTASQDWCLLRVRKDQGESGAVTDPSCSGWSEVQETGRDSKVARLRLWRQMFSTAGAATQWPLSEKNSYL